MINLHPILKKGFTLIELLVVIAIIGILATIVLTNVQGVRSRARDARRKTDLDNIKTALQLYYNDNASYPNNTGTAITGYPWGGAFASGTTVYMQYLSSDPASTSSAYPTNYQYDRINTDQFALVAKLENQSDNDITTSQTRCSAAYASASAITKDAAKDYVICND